ncbi:MAG: hypothetical protein JRF20_07395 [Deltaproteobacteria bacterium]|nr:hypothetical protein [Deltaproteobacteria bacterium]MBW1938137.1 hypothetical protein [Deltaproteobacteria bacterium]MBW1965351.1 hypothetical protein [Deltaproteobacteria bacterium]MBW2080093.1 hypothetical protein [Deltaproteobacteria bacterium]MBW2351000.1 hypothetical protein [Deltaproteobacteria bacterium]
MPGKGPWPGKDSGLSPQVTDDKKHILSEEALLILNSGEVPEVAYYGSIHYLTEDPEGPCFNIEPQDLTSLEEAVVRRYRTIILRDVTLGNRGKSIYRGLKRCAANWKRLVNFSDKRSIDIFSIRKEVIEALKDFLSQEIVDLSSGKRKTCINCSYSVLTELAYGLGLSRNDLPARVKMLCTAK